MRSENLIPQTQPREMFSSSPVLSPRDAFSARGRSATCDAIIAAQNNGRLLSPVSSMAFSEARHRAFGHSNTLPARNFEQASQSWSMMNMNVMSSASGEMVSGLAFSSAAAADARSHAAPPPLSMSLEVGSSISPLAAQLNRERTGSTVSNVTIPPLSPASTYADPRSTCSSINLDGPFNRTGSVMSVESMSVQEDLSNRPSTPQARSPHGSVTGSSPGSPRRLEYVKSTNF